MCKQMGAEKSERFQIVDPARRRGFHLWCSASPGWSLLAENDPSRIYESVLGLHAETTGMTV